MVAIPAPYQAKEDSHNSHKTHATYPARAYPVQDPDLKNVLTYVQHKWNFETAYTRVYKYGRRDTLVNVRGS